MIHRINILICTIDEGIYKIAEILKEKPGINYIVSHQFTKSEYKHLPESLTSRKDVVISQISGKGLSRNRNNALLHAQGDIALIADDDIEYINNAFEEIDKIFQDNPEMDVACFKIKSLDGEPEYKDYPVYSYIYNKHQHHRISSIEIAFRINRIIEKGIFFDERFGLGSDFLNAGEEAVFINDCIKKGLKIAYYPIFIVKHTYQSTLRELPSYDNTRAKVASAVDACVNPFLAIPKALARTIKHLPEMARNKVSPIRFFNAGLTAIFYIYFSRKTR